MWPMSSMRLRSRKRFLIGRISLWIGPVRSPPAPAWWRPLRIARPSPERSNWFAPYPPKAGWSRNNRTIFDFSASYGTVSQPGSPTLKTSIYHADGERDEYFSARVFAFGEAAFDHNYSQGLDLQQTYSGGIGWSVIKEANQTLDLKASMSYINQEFANTAGATIGAGTSTTSVGPSKATATQSLIGSTFSEAYLRKLMHGIAFTESATVTPAWNNTNAYSAIGSVGLTLPAYKRLAVSLNATDAYLNDPPPAFKKNSFQFTLGLTYSLR